MKNYEEQYFQVFDAPFNDAVFSLKPSLETGRRRYTFTKLDFGDGPITFVNSDKGDIPFVLSNFFLHGFFPIVSKEIADVIKGYDIDGFQLFPTVLIDDDDKWHEDFFFFNLYQELDFVDFENSEIQDFEPGDTRYDVVRYKFKDDVLNAIPLEERLIIRPKNVWGRGVFIHESIVSKIEKSIDQSSFRFLRMSDYKLGDEFKP
ncbi:imm11 family protein [Vibrio neptunius]|uniref:Immunity MXAN-0049 protein domain-containing protein n=1 Tax=Vibrio neptunius TaxID=170651 RepID=A0ABS2ZXK0_9VIBR|nr:DUF1629 domain-containing protein [Vibrio neptunius]MBN3492238.1 hypothetical protein [Vibrio neptunius]MBN3514735.1 hypothetical protein [Vibrio neptunius]MBN3552110.1 hypothetical protein [Vibrio neptunius]MBN3576664.1 hypothetical protein [Vibrio neptunius]MCH9870328.1 hypothetical protein [Vibrio neptunius]